MVVDPLVVEVAALLFTISLVQVGVCLHFCVTRCTPPLVLGAALTPVLWILLLRVPLPDAAWLDGSLTRLAATTAVLAGAVVLSLRSDDPRLPVVLTALNGFSASLLVVLAVAVTRLA